jgi:hypothetical protein
LFATLRAELVDHERHPTREAAMRSIGDCIDNFNNVERRHSYLGYLIAMSVLLAVASHERRDRTTPGCNQTSHSHTIGTR